MSNRPKIKAKAKSRAKTRPLSPTPEPEDIPTALVAVGVACNKWQSPQWWSLKDQVLLPMQKERLEWFKSGALTDSARNYIVDQFLNSPHRPEWLFQMDDDTVPPPWAVYKMHELAQLTGARFITGIYHRRTPPFDPLIFLRNADGTYAAVLDIQEGPFYVDSCGIGCSLIHRSVFTDIMDAHKLFMWNGILLPVHKDSLPDTPEGYEPVEAPGVLAAGADPSQVVMAGAQPLDGLPEGREWPFYCFAFTRTEDHWFCELAGRVGVRPLVHPMVNCVHLGEHGVSRRHLEGYLSRPEGLKAMSQYYRVLAQKGMLEYQTPELEADTLQRVMSVEMFTDVSENKLESGGTEVDGQEASQ